MNIERGVVLSAMFEAGIPKGALLADRPGGFGFEVRHDALSDAVEFLSAVALVADHGTAVGLSEVMCHDLSGPRLAVVFPGWQLVDRG